MSSCTVTDCACGRTYFTTAQHHGDFEEGELESLLEWQSKEPDKFISSAEYDSIDIVMIGGKEFIPQCDCGGAKKYLDFFEENFGNLIRYCSERIRQKKAHAEAELQRQRLNESIFKITRLPIGTRIRFIKDLREPATGDHPEFIYAEKDSLGVVTGHCEREGHMVTWDSWPTPFGAMYGTEFVQLEIRTTD